MKLGDSNTVKDQSDLHKNLDETETDSQTKNFYADEEGGMVPINATPGTLWSGKRICWLIVMIIFSILTGVFFFYSVVWVYGRQAYIDAMVNQSTGVTYDQATTAWNVTCAILFVLFGIFDFIFICALCQYKKATKECRRANQVVTTHQVVYYDQQPQGAYQNMNYAQQPVYQNINQASQPAPVQVNVNMPPQQQGHQNMDAPNPVPQQQNMGHAPQNGYYNQQN